MTRQQLEEIERRMDKRQGRHITTWSVEMWHSNMSDIRNLISEVKRCWTEADRPDDRRPE